MPTNDKIPIAAFLDGTVIGIFGKREYRLFPSYVSCSGNHWGQKYESTVPLEGMRLEPELLLVHGQAFRLGIVLIGVALLLDLATCLIFRDYQRMFGIWYLGTAGIIAVSIGRA